MVDARPTLDPNLSSSFLRENFVRIVFLPFFGAPENKKEKIRDEIEERRKQCQRKVFLPERFLGEGGGGEGRGEREEWGLLETQRSDRLKKRGRI